MKHKLIDSFTIAGSTMCRNCRSAEILVGNPPTRAVFLLHLPDGVRRSFAPQKLVVETLKSQRVGYNVRTLEAVREVAHRAIVFARQTGRARISEPAAITKQTRKVIAVLSGQLGDCPYRRLCTARTCFQFLANPQNRRYFANTS